MRNFASTLVKFSKLSHIQTTVWRPPKMAPPRTAGSAGPFVTPLAYSWFALKRCTLQGSCLSLIVDRPFRYCWSTLLASVGQVTTGMNHSCLLSSVTCIGKKRVTLSSAELYFKSIHILYLSAAPRIYLFTMIIKSRAYNYILTRVQRRRVKPIRNPVVSVPCLTCRIARTFTTLARRGTISEACWIYDFELNICNLYYILSFYSNLYTTTLLSTLKLKHM